MLLIELNFLLNFLSFIHKISHIMQKATEDKIKNSLIKDIYLYFKVIKNFK